jgi:sugar-specific transcriptional regulator TrmB
LLARLYILIPTNDHSLGRAGEDIFGTVTDNQDSYNSISWRLLSGASKRLDCCLDYISELEPSFTKELMDFLTGPKKRRELQIRIVANITKDNLPILKQLMKYSEVYHMEGLLGTFYIIDGSAYLYDVEEAGGERKHSRRLLYSTHPQFVKMQQQLFENLINRAVPAKEKLKEIERGAEREFIETIQDPAAALQLAKDLVHSASFEILVLFSTINSFYRAENDGLLDLLGKASSHGAVVKVLIKIENEAMKDASKQKIKQKHERINVNFIERAVKSKITTIVVDQTFSLAMEVSDDSKNDSSAATGLSTYSNSESTVFTYYSMFENLWIQAELERQGKVRQAYFHIFKGQRLKDEVYRKKWNLVDSD